MFQNLTNNIILSAGDMSTATLTSSVVDLDGADGYAVYAKFTGAPVGTIKLQVSVDGVNYVDLANSSVAISAAGDFLWEVSSAFYNKMQVVYTKSSGTGSLTVQCNTKGETV